MSRKKKGKARGMYTLCICLLAAACSLSAILFVLGGLKEYQAAEIPIPDTDRAAKICGVLTSREIEQIKSMAGGTAVETESYGDRIISIQNRMQQAVILGDSRAEGFAYYGVLGEDSVLAKAGMSLTEARTYVDLAASREPEVIFLNYGLNDIGITNGDSGLFLEQYQKLIESLQSALPQTRIYINTILPVRQDALESTPGLASVAEYNVRIRELCEEKGVGCIDMESEGTDAVYEPDGIHLKPEYYLIWAGKMADAAGL